MNWDALRFRIQKQIGHQTQRDEDDLHELYPEFYCEALDWVLEQIDNLECAELKSIPAMPDNLVCDTCED